MFPLLPGYHVFCEVRAKCEGRVGKGCVFCEVLIGSEEGFELRVFTYLSS